MFDYEAYLLEKTGLTLDQFDQLMEDLEGLRLMFELKGKPTAGADLERYCGLKHFSDQGRECSYVKKAAMMFIDSGRLSELIQKVKNIGTTA